MAGVKSKGGKKNRKWSRNKLFCAKYRTEGRQQKNKLRRIARHLKLQPNDVQARRCLSNHN